MKINLKTVIFLLDSIHIYVNPENLRFVAVFLDSLDLAPIYLITLQFRVHV